MTTAASEIDFPPNTASEKPQKSTHNTHTHTEHCWTGCTAASSEQRSVFPRTARCGVPRCFSRRSLLIWPALCLGQRWQRRPRPRQQWWWRAASTALESTSTREQCRVDSHDDFTMLGPVFCQAIRSWLCYASALPTSAFRQLPRATVPPQ